MCSSTFLFVLFSWAFTRGVVPYNSGSNCRAVSDSFHSSDLCGGRSCERGYPVSQVSDSMPAILALVWALELELGTHNPCFVCRPLIWRKGLTIDALVRPLELGLGTHNPRFGVAP